MDLSKDRDKEATTTRWHRLPGHNRPFGHCFNFSFCTIVRTTVIFREAKPRFGIIAKNTLWHTDLTAPKSPVVPSPQSTTHIYLVHTFITLYTPRRIFAIPLSATQIVRQQSERPNETCMREVRCVFCTVSLSRSLPFALIISHPTTTVHLLRPGPSGFLVSLCPNLPSSFPRGVSRTLTGYCLSL